MGAMGCAEAATGAGPGLTNYYLAKIEELEYVVACASPLSVRATPRARDARGVTRSPGASRCHSVCALAAAAERTHAQVAPEGGALRALPVCVFRAHGARARRLWGAALRRAGARPAQGRPDMRCCATHEAPQGEGRCSAVHGRPRRRRARARASLRRQPHRMARMRGGAAPRGVAHMRARWLVRGARVARRARGAPRERAGAVRCSAQIFAHARSSARALAALFTPADA